MAAFSSLLASSILVALAYLAILAAGVVAAVLRAGGRRDSEPDHDALSASRFTIPVSVIIPAGGNEPGTSRAIAAALALNYPEIEIVVVVDGMAEPHFAELVRAWRLEAKEFFYRPSIETGLVRRLYRSRRDARVMVADKAPAGLADTLNLGINLARYRYVVPISPDIVYDTNALLRVMAAPLRDPATVVGAGGHVERTGLVARLASIRSIAESRLVWRYLEHGLGPADVVAVWRRDAVIAAGGFSSAAVSPDLDLMRRLQTSDDARSAGRFHRSSQVFGTLPTPFRAAVKAAARRRRAAFQLLTACTPRDLDVLGGAGVACFMSAEILTPLAQTWVLVGTVIGAVSGIFSWSAVPSAMLLLALGHGTVTTAALLVRGASPGAPGTEETRRLALAAPLEWLSVRPVVALASLFYR